MTQHPETPSPAREVEQLHRPGQRCSSRYPKEDAVPEIGRGEGHQAMILLAGEPLEASCDLLRTGLKGSGQGQDGHPSGKPSSQEWSLANLPSTNTSTQASVRR